MRRRTFLEKQLDHCCNVSLRGWYSPGAAAGGHVLVSEFRGMALNGLFCADVLRPLDLVPSLTLPTNTTLATDFLYNYRTVLTYKNGLLN